MPILVLFHREKMWRGLKQYMLLTMESTRTMQEFKTTLELKLLWNGYLTQTDRTFFMAAKHKQLPFDSTPVDT